ncbi:AI-2E family transporter [Thaumasiovibrio sp. DFM-14]|uniref:AI-2E family transporter n=1 Tax=Thaumasiovibrio sp. DFM-14 TaxID=3384792 RepID=UPI0039A20F6A
MFEMLNGWYKKRFSDPHATALLVLLVVGFLTIYFLGHLIAPVLAAIVLAYLLEWPVMRLVRLGAPRTLSVVIVVLIFMGLMLLAVFGLVPTVWRQVANFLADIPNMFNSFQAFVLSLPERYPELVDETQVLIVMDSLRLKMLGLGESVLKGSLASLVNIATIAVYMILVPLLVFFLLKDKEEMLTTLSSILPRNRRLTDKVGTEMNQQISNYIRGKVTEILIVGSVAYVMFLFLGLQYAVLLSVLAGVSVLIPYIGAAAVTVPIMMVALFQWGVSGETWWVLIAYGVLQALDGNVLVPVLFSEAVNLHPVAIIIAVLVFGGLWGFWGVFFAIPLATLVKAVWRAFPSPEHMEAE